MVGVYIDLNKRIMIACPESVAGLREMEKV